MTGTISGKMIAKEWFQVTPELSPYADTGLYKILGPLIIGIHIDLLRDGKRYSPYFILVPITDFQGKANGFTTMVQAETGEKKQLFLPASEYNNISDDTKNVVLSQLNIPLDEDVSQASVYKMLDRFKTYINVKIRPSYGITFNVLKLHVALYVDDVVQVNQTLTAIDQEIAATAPHLLTAWFGDYVAWQQQLHTMVANRPAYLEKLKELKRDKKLLKLKSNEIYR